MHGIIEIGGHVAVVHELGYSMGKHHQSQTDAQQKQAQVNATLRVFDGRKFSHK
jgi:hypothetical protein